VPAGARHLHGHHVELPARLHRGATALTDRQARVVAVQQRDAADTHQYRGVMAHGRLLGDEGEPVAAGVEREVLPGRHLDDVGDAGLEQTPVEVPRRIAVDHHPRVRAQAPQDVEVHVVQVLVGDRDPVGVEQLRGVEVVVARQLVPRAEEGASP
jgi:hypothetical protein